MLQVAGFAVPLAVVQTAGLSAAAALLATVVLRFEAELPLSICMLVIPPVTGLGMSLAIWLQFVVGLSLYEAWGVLGVALLALVCCHEGVKRFREEPRPPTARYS